MATEPQSYHVIARLGPFHRGGVLLPDRRAQKHGTCCAAFYVYRL